MPESILDVTVIWKRQDGVVELLTAVSENGEECFFPELTRLDEVSDIVFGPVLSFFPQFAKLVGLLPKSAVARNAWEHSVYGWHFHVVGVVDVEEIVADESESDLKVDHYPRWVEVSQLLDPNNACPLKKVHLRGLRMLVRNGVIPLSESVPAERQHVYVVRVNRL